MGERNRWAAVACGMAAGLAGCVPSSAGDYEIDWNVDTYTAEVTQGEPTAWKAPLYRPEADAAGEVHGTVDLVNIPRFTKWPESTTRVDLYRVRVHVRDGEPFQECQAHTPAQWLASVPTDGRGNGNGSEPYHDDPRAGPRVEVRDPLGRVLLVGRLPVPGSPGLRSAAYGGEEGLPGLTIESRCARESGRESLSFGFRRFAAGIRLDVSLAGSDGVLRPAGSATLDAHGAGVLAWDSRGGDPLPAGAVSVLDLSGSPFEVRVGGILVFEGLVP